MIKFIIFKDSKNEFRWHLKARNGKIIASSGEGFKRKFFCRQSILRVEELIMFQTLVIIDKTKVGSF